LKDKLCHLLASEQEEMSQLILQFGQLFPDVPGKTECVFHDVDVGDATHIKQHPYHANPNQQIEVSEKGSRIHVRTWNHRAQSK